ncbi:MAG: MarR family transcriptional regulator [Clostridia bacterium]|nr:MarR family transcriptional regulator [Clostridia bacterium]
MDTLNYDTLRLENQICFPLYAASRELIKKYKPHLDQLDLTYTQYITMILLWENKTMTVKELGSRLYLDSGTLTPLLKKLESKGLITRTRSMEDERNLNVSLTEQGVQMQAIAADIPAKVAQDTRLDAEDAQTLYRILYRILSETEE